MASKGLRETITFSCDPKFKKLITTKVKEFGYQNKSQMIRDALQNFFESEKGLENIEDSMKITVIISVVYDHHDLNTISQFIEAQHDLNLSYSYHHHMQPDECLENLIVKDEAKNIRFLLKKLRTIQGIKYISLQLVSRTQA
ncbi:MAG: CopG family ribbon-helix-helix protein [Candidatus Heimdallarchaeota archaeon]|nr:MAG: CopG family ribbon-helix-helix protein [Candidatus Heimdallarchaeota archaeon]